MRLAKRACFEAPEDVVKELHWRLCTRSFGIGWTMVEGDNRHDLAPWA